MKYEKPFRLGRKQKRAILDANGIEVCVFPVGNEREAEITCGLYNGHYVLYEHIIDLFDYDKTYSKADIINKIKQLSA